MKFIFIDGYNVINSWGNLKKEKDINLDSSRQKLIDIMHNYGAINNCMIKLVFDGHKVTGNIENKYEYSKNLTIIFTKDGETADAYIEKSVHLIGRKFEVYVVTSDSLEQQTIFQRGAVRISSMEFYKQVYTSTEDVQKNIKKNIVKEKNTLDNYMDEDVLKKLEAIRRS